MFERNRIAETLRNAREKQGLTLEQAAAAAGIPTQYVRLLEGETNVSVGVSDELYLIPFFRKYARFVGIDAEEMLPEFVGFVQQLPGEGSPPIRLTYRSRWSFLWKPAAVVLTIAVAVVLMLRGGPDRRRAPEEVASRRDEIPATTDQAPATPAVMLTPANLNQGVIASPTQEEVDARVTAAAPSFTATPGPHPSVTPESVAAESRQLQIAAKEETWLSLALDDQPSKQYLLRAGESRTWTASIFTITVGNAGGITLSLDGRELPALGQTGRVVRNIRIPTETAAKPTP